MRLLRLPAGPQRHVHPVELHITISYFGLTARRLAGGVRSTLTLCSDASPMRTSNAAEAMAAAVSSIVQRSQEQANR